MTIALTEQERAKLISNGVIKIEPKPVQAMPVENHPLGFGPLFPQMSHPRKPRELKYRET
jgi:hypothetical protein